MVAFRNNLRVLVYLIISLESNVFACLEDSKIEILVLSKSGEGRATLGEELEITCSVNTSKNATDVQSIEFYSRNIGRLNTSCSASSTIRECLFRIDKVESRNEGLYDCIVMDKDNNCFTKTIRLVVTHRLDSTPQATAETGVTETDIIRSKKATVSTDARPKGGSTTRNGHITNIIITFLLVAPV